MSRFRRALAGAAMAVAMAGGGLLASAPAHAATAPAPASRTFSFTAVPAAQAGGGIGPRFQCGETCDPSGGGGNPPPPPTTITCEITAAAPIASGASGSLDFNAFTDCTSPVARISMGQDVIHSTPPIPGNPLTDSVVVTNLANAITSNVAPCVTGQYAVSASAYITPPAGWVVIGPNPIVDTSPTVTINCGGGGGGGGGCATGTPSVPAQPAARHPDVISCP
jgi:hypothetical protein